MRWSSVFLICICILFPSGCDNTFSSRPLPPIEVHFSPRGGCTDAIVGEIKSARTSILIQAYSFTSAPIAKAMVEAHRRGVHVEIILDRSHKTTTYSSADFLLHAGIPVLIDSEHAIAHNKIMIIDGQTVITGSFNFTKQAEQSNAENLLVIRDKILADQYTANWKLHADHSEVYTGKKTE
jgi:phosphatidylserine/phosphatidylglycerophosphate/cardiolipin synthase-like enzyme